MGAGDAGVVARTGGRGHDFDRNFRWRGSDVGVRASDYLRLGDLTKKGNIL